MLINVIKILMIFAGVLGLPAAACSACWAVMGAAAAGDAASRNAQFGGQNPDAAAAASGGIFLVFALLALGSGAGAIVCGAMVRQLGKVKTAVACFTFAILFSALIIGLNLMGLPSAFMLALAGVMSLVATPDQYEGVTRVVQAYTPPPTQAAT